MYNVAKKHKFMYTLIQSRGKSLGVIVESLVNILAQCAAAVKKKHSIFGNIRKETQHNNNNSSNKNNNSVLIKHYNKS